MANKTTLPRNGQPQYTPSTKGPELQALLSSLSPDLQAAVVAAIHAQVQATPKVQVVAKPKPAVQSLQAQVDALKAQNNVLKGVAVQAIKKTVEAAPETVGFAPAASVQPHMVLGTILPCPKLAGKAPAIRYANYSTGLTVAQVIAKGSTMQDLRWDLAHGYITLISKS